MATKFAVGIHVYLLHDPVVRGRVVEYQLKGVTEWIRVKWDAPELNESEWLLASAFGVVA